MSGVFNQGIDGIEVPSNGKEGDNNDDGGNNVVDNSGNNGVIKMVMEGVIEMKERMVNGKCFFKWKQ